MDLSPTDAYQVRAAVGWLELGNSDEALAELDQLSSEGQTNPDVLEIRWLVLSQRKNWDEAVVIGAKLIIAAPERASSWLHHSAGSAACWSVAVGLVPRDAGGLSPASP